MTYSYPRSAAHLLIGRMAFDEGQTHPAKPAAMRPVRADATHDLRGLDCASMLHGIPRSQAAPAPTKARTLHRFDALILSRYAARLGLRKATRKPSVKP